MKHLVSLALAALASSALYAVQPTVADGDNRLTWFNPTSEDWASRIRLSAGGFGEFGTELKHLNINQKECKDLYGSRLDLQVNLLSKRDFNLWVGLGATYTPEQKYVSYSYTEQGLGYVYNGNEKMEFESYGLRLFTVPEWQVTQQLALGLRLGVEILHAETTFTGSDVAVFAGGGTASDSWKDRYSDTLVRGIAGLQATWMFTDHFGLTAYGEGHFGNKMSFEDDGEKWASFDTTAFEAGIALTWQF